MHPTPRFKTTILAVLAVGIAAGSSHAAPITWGSATDVAATTDVSTNGTLVEAYNLGHQATGLSTVTVNGVEFTASVKPPPLTSTNTNPYNQLDGNSSGDADYDNLLDSIAYGGGSGLSTMTVGGGSLLNGKQYEIQLWFVEERLNDGSGNDVTGRVMQYGDGFGGGMGNTVNLGNTAGLLGHHVIGTFTADGTSQTLTMDPQGFGNSHLTAYQIRDISGPAVAPRISSFTPVGTNLWELTLSGDANTAYEFYSSTTLEFTPGTLLEGLTQGDSENDPGDIGGTNSSVLTTDSSGDGKVRITLTGNPADFVRAQSVP